MKKVKFENIDITPSKIVCVGRNYVEHIKELNNEIPDNMVIFNKPNSAISDKLYFINDSTRFEGEICFLVEGGKLVGIGFGFDLTKKDIQDKLKQKGLPWERAKGFNKSAVFSEFVRINNTNNLEMRLYKHSKLIQLAKNELMIYKPDQILKEILSFMDLEDGDIIMSGTPKGVGFYKRGDEFISEIYQNQKLLLRNLWKVI